MGKIAGPWYNLGMQNSKEYNRLYYLAHKDRYRGAYSRDKHFRRKYRITLEDYRRMLEGQNGRCAICGTNQPGGRYKVFHVDHHHETGAVRGLLCNNCNAMIGLAKDDRAVLEAAINYLASNVNGDGNHLRGSSDTDAQ